MCIKMTSIFFSHIRKDSYFLWEVTNNSSSNRAVGSKRHFSPEKLLKCRLCRVALWNLNYFYIYVYCRFLVKLTATYLPLCCVVDVPPPPHPGRYFLMIKVKVNRISEQSKPDFRYIAC